MAITETSVDELVDRENGALSDLLALVGGVAPDTPVGDGTWTAHDVLAHLVTVGRRYLNPRTRLAESLSEVAAVNTEELAAARHRSQEALTEELAANQAMYQQVWAQLPLEAEFPFHAGLRFDVATLRANWLAELRVHGWDIAQAAGVPFALGDRDMLLALRVVLRAFPALVHGDTLAAADIALHVDGGAPQRIVVADGNASVTAEAGDGDGAAAATVTAPAPAAALLFYQRLRLDQAEALGTAVTGDRVLVERLLDACEAP